MVAAIKCKPKEFAKKIKFFTFVDLSAQQFERCRISNKVVSVQNKGPC
jgi:hypothetical protein